MESEKEIKESMRERMAELSGGTNSAGLLPYPVRSATCSHAAVESSSDDNSTLCSCLAIFLPSDKSSDQRRPLAAQLAPISAQPAGHLSGGQLPSRRVVSTQRSSEL